MLIIIADIFIVIYVYAVNKLSQSIFCTKIDAILMLLINRKNEHSNERFRS